MSDASTLRHDPPPTPADRERIAWLVFAIAGPPLLWTLQILVLASFANYACYPDDYAIATSPGLNWVAGIKIGIDVLAIVVAVASGIASWRYYTLAHQRISQHSDPVSVWHLDRLCFMALGGLLSSGGFLGAIVFETIASFMVRICNA